MSPGGSAPVDAVVLGGGPAGTAAALALVQLGRSVTLLERSRYDCPRVGEAFPPEIRGPLDELGLWNHFMDENPIASPGTISIWGRPDPQCNDHISNPSGPGWHVDRTRFDTMMATAAQAAGAEIILGARVNSCVATPSGNWQIEATHDDGYSVECSAHVLVDATGRRSLAARRLGIARTVHDRLVAAWAVIDNAPDTDSHDRRALIEATECGWWYSALLPGGRQAAAFMTDSDLLPSGPTARNHAWHTLLAQARHTRFCLDSTSTRSSPRIVPACTSRLHTIAGPGWLAVGDAAMSFDPLSAHGVTWALESALAAARALHAHLGGNPTLMQDYARRASIDFHRYLQDRRAIYSLERRWPNSPFWHRRVVGHASA